MYDSTFRVRPHRIGPNLAGQKRSNAWGLHDMLGNVGEWCWDGYDADYYKQSPANDPTGPQRSLFRVVRGGSYADDLQHAQSASRQRYGPVLQDSFVGFRVARFQSGG
jgi:formylglycine-generating enzyme required for sulfatase activity